MKKKCLRRTTVVLLAVLMTFSVTFYSYAGEYYSFRNDSISMEMPEGWELTETGAADSKDKAYEHILTGEEVKTDNPLKLDLFFSYNEIEADEYIYFHGDPLQAMEYYDKYGRDAVMQVYNGIIEETAQSGSVSYGDPVFLDGEWNGFLKISVSLTRDVDGDGVSETGSEMVYLTAHTSDSNEFVINNMLIFKNDYGNYGDTEVSAMMDNVANGFYDYEYGEEMTGGVFGGYEEESYSGNYAAGDILDLIMLALCIAVPVIIVAAALRKRRRIVKAVNMANIKRPADNNKAKRNKKKDMQSPAVTYTARETSGAEQRYMESLKTLYRSGLLTKAEMNEMLEKHQRYNIRKGGR